MCHVSYVTSQIIFDKLLELACGVFVNNGAYPILLLPKNVYRYNQVSSIKQVYDFINKKGQYYEITQIQDHSNCEMSYNSLKKI